MNRTEISEVDFIYILEKLLTTIQKYQDIYPELSLIEKFIDNLEIEHSSRLDFLIKICEYTKEKAPDFYVIRFIHIHLEKDLEKLRMGIFFPDDKPWYLEFAKF